MSAKPSLFKETDFKRAFQAAKLAGVDVARIDISKGMISIVPKEPVATEAPKKVLADSTGLQSWD
jgi:hypothetical protein